MMNREIEKHENILRQMDVVSDNSRDTTTKVGAIVIGPDGEPRASGYNDFPRGVDDFVLERRERPLKYKWTEHAERNAFYNAARVGVSLKGCTLYVTWIPCCDCARGVIQTGISRVIVDGRNLEEKKKHWAARWKEDCLITIQMFEEAGIELSVLTEKGYDKTEFELLDHHSRRDFRSFLLDV